MSDIVLMLIGLVVGLIGFVAGLKGRAGRKEAEHDAALARWEADKADAERRRARHETQVLREAFHDAQKRLKMEQDRARGGDRTHFERGMPDTDSG